MPDKDLRMLSSLSLAKSIAEIPKTICICGSTKFADRHAVLRWELEKVGNICLMINYLPQSYAEKQGWEGSDHFADQAGLKEELDTLHLRKIDLCDEVYVVNVDNYIGESTAAEIKYAELTCKPIIYLEHDRSSVAHIDVCLRCGNIKSPTCKKSN